MATRSLAAVFEPETIAEPDAEAAAIAFLRAQPGANVRHSNTTLLSHLEGVYRKLTAWNCRPAVRFAGLFHSVYGTEHFRRQTVQPSRQKTLHATGDR